MSNGTVPREGGLTIDTTECPTAPPGAGPAAVDVGAKRALKWEARARAVRLRAQSEERRRQYLEISSRVEQPTAGPPLAELHTRAEAAENRTDVPERALASNRRIGMAIGILIERLHVTEEQAFELLR
ncbi:ANTAR domain-containing protein [Geodermatophilus chilensis]|uniref:ANTAR domain-containing protein n=1 Tax=Geodermatophilus chilensis TaxID=2035835 RepID=UPI0018E41280|nr:ANTAR domain-containing protein [Geodermatophilus chilensis]